jgi:hypothetical protein
VKLKTKFFFGFCAKVIQFTIFDVFPFPKTFTGRNELTGSLPAAGTNQRSISKTIKNYQICQIL